jgi:hypothetical protein
MHASDNRHFICLRDAVILNTSLPHQEKAILDASLYSQLEADEDDEGSLSRQWLDYKLMALEKAGWLEQRSELSRYVPDAGQSYYFGSLMHAAIDQYLPEDLSLAARQLITGLQTTPDIIPTVQSEAHQLPEANLAPLGNAVTVTFSLLSVPSTKTAYHLTVSVTTDKPACAPVLAMQLVAESIKSIHFTFRQYELLDLFWMNSEQISENVEDYYDACVVSLDPAKP